MTNTKYFHTKIEQNTKVELKHMKDKIISKKQFEFNQFELCIFQIESEINRLKDIILLQEDEKKNYYNKFFTEENFDKNMKNKELHMELKPINNENIKKEIK